jgi:hypothetical protein
MSICFDNTLFENTSILVFKKSTSYKLHDVFFFNTSWFIISGEFGLLGMAVALWSIGTGNN